MARVMKAARKGRVLGTEGRGLRLTEVVRPTFDDEVVVEEANRLRGGTELEEADRGDGEEESIRFGANPACLKTPFAGTRRRSSCDAWVVVRPNIAIVVLAAPVLLDAKELTPCRSEHECCVRRERGS